MPYLDAWRELEVENLRKVSAGMGPSNKLQEVLAIEGGVEEWRQQVDPEKSDFCEFRTAFLRGWWGDRA